jgi:quercetin dioxygenase-like cupin family protein
MTESSYFEPAGDPSDEPGRFVRFADVEPLNPVPGLEFRPVTTDSAMANHVTFAPNAVADTHHHSEEQMVIVLDGELTFTVGQETQVLHAGDCVVIPAHVPHGGNAGAEGCHVLDVFTPPRAAIAALMR